jgi:hypothetical protein
VFVAPSSSGLANGHTRERLAAYSELARWLRSAAAASSMIRLRRGRRAMASGTAAG